ncbi:MAG: hypothetical protein AAGE96_23630 [Cyanobacteria bacterium P01_G01_bin.19]
MQTKQNVGLVLNAIIIPILTLFAATSTKAQYGDRDPHYYCDGYARDRTARFAERDDFGAAAEDAIGGAILGAIIGGIAGDAGKGAGIGAGVGVVGGGAERAKDRKAFYRREYDACMRRNGR